MKIHEYQAKEVLRRAGVPIPSGDVAATVDEAVVVAEKLAADGASQWVVKAQIHAGGRGKGGGVKLAGSIDEVRELATKILGMRLVTPQNAPDGTIVRQVLVTAACDIAKEYYAGIVLDRERNLPVLMVSAEGGVEIETVAAESPEKIFKEWFCPIGGLAAFQGRKLARKLDMSGKNVAKTASIFTKLARSFLDTDASIAEINPLVETPEGEVVALDAKFGFDDNALYRQPAVVEYRDRDEEDPLEARAAEFDLSYIKLDGEIGCMVNGAGLAMSTLDIINYFGGEPANFLDVGGGATADKVTEAFKIILEDSSVKAILVNIFGGIMKCDVIAEGVIAAARAAQLSVPLVVRLEGTNVERGRELLESSGIDLIAASGLADAAKKVVEASRGAAGGVS